MPTSHSGHHHVLFFFQKSLRNLFWSSFLRQNGLGLVDLFTFVFIYKVGAEEHFFAMLGISDFRQGILTVVLYVLLLRLATVLCVFPMAKWAAKAGLPKAAIVGNFLLACQFALLAMATHFPLLIFLAGIVEGVEIAGFTPAYDTMFAKLASSTKVGRDVGAFTFILKLSYALLPVFAGVLIITFGFQALFIATVALLLLANIPLLTMRWHEKLAYPRPEKFAHWYQRDVDPKVLGAILGRYVSDTVFGLWPIYVLLVIGKIERLGLITTIALFISLVLAYFSGWYIDHSRKNIPFVLGGVLLSLFWLGRIGAVTIQIILVLEIAQRIVESFFYPSFDAYVYRISKHVDTFAFCVYKEILLSTFSLVLWFVIGALTLFSGSLWSWVFLFAALGILSSTVLYTTKQYA